MLKIKIRKKLIKKRKNNYNNKQKISFLKILNILLNKNIKKGIIGGYFPVNYEIDDLNLLREFEKKKYICNSEKTGSAYQERKINYSSPPFKKNGLGLIYKV